MGEPEGSGVRWFKGHGTENDFLLVPDHDGTLLAGPGSAVADLVAAMCHRRRGLGADGVLRVVRADALDEPGAQAAVDAGAVWFMDYRNADGSLSEMCGNGVRVFARHLAAEGLVDPSQPLPVGTRAGVRVVTYSDDGSLSVTMGPAAVGAPVQVHVDGRRLPAVAVDVGNPHAVAFVEDLAQAGSLLTAPQHDPRDFPAGVNVEFAVRTGMAAVSMRVHERGSGETRSCGTGAVAVAAAFAHADGLDAPLDVAVRVPGGDLTVSLLPDGETVLHGPAELVASGRWPRP